MNREFRTMHFLSEEQVLEITKRFEVNAEFLFVRVIDYEPDCKVYILKDKDDNEYALIARDYALENIEAEKRILSSELNIDLLDRIHIKEGDSYWSEDNSFDSFRYVFNLCRIKILSNE